MMPRFVIPYLLVFIHLLPVSDAHSSDRLIFSSVQRSGRTLAGLYVADSDGGNLVALPADEKSAYWAPRWSADGSKIVFWGFSQQTQGVNAIFTANSDWTNITQVTDGSASISPDWSPDGSKIVFTSKHGVATFYSLYTINSDGSGLTALTAAESNDHGPKWSPDGSKIAFVGYRDNKFSIFTINADGTNSTQLTDASGDDASPDWSPDGSKIVFSSTRSGGSGASIHVMNSDGSGITSLAHDLMVEDREPVWSPDGSKIAFLSNRDPGGTLSVFTMNADGTNITQVTDANGYEAYPDWGSVSVTYTTPPPTDTGTSGGGTTTPPPTDTGTSGGGTTTPPPTTDTGTSGGGTTTPPPTDTGTSGGGTTSPPPTDTGTSGGGTTTPSEPSPFFFVSKDTLKFGQLFLGATKSLELTVENTSDRDAASFPTSVIGMGARNFRTDSSRIAVAAQGETTFSVSFKPVQVGAHSVVLNVDFGFGFVELVLTGTAVLPNPPLADFSVDYPDTALALRFGDLSRGGGIQQYIWDFGDGAISAESNPVHIYAEDGVYTVELTVRNARGSHSTRREVSTASSGAPRAASPARFRASATSGRAPFAVQFATEPTDNNPIYRWDFGDGSTSIKPVPTHVYSDPGTYLVQLEVDDGTASHNHAEWISIFPSLDISLNTSSRFGLVPLGVDFAAEATGDDLSYIWRFGDGFSSVERNPSHTYKTPGVYNVELVVSDQYGAQSIFKKKYIRVTSPGAPVIFSEVDTLDLGSVAIGQTQITPLAIRNIGTESARSFPVSFLGSNRSFFAATPERMELSASSVDTVKFSFAPTALGTFSSVVNLDFNSTFLEVVLVGRGIAPPPRMEVETDTLEFAEQDRGTTSTKAIWLSNHGPGVLEVSDIELNTTEFTVDPSAFSLDVGDTQRVAITYLRSTPGTQTDILTIHSNARDSSRVEVALRGQTTAPPRIKLSASKMVYLAKSLGAVETQNIMVTNTGWKTLRVSAVSIDSTAFTATPASFAIARGDTQIVSVQYDRSHSGQDQAVLSLNSDDPETPIAYVRLQGNTRFPPRLVVAPADTLDFGTVELGDQPTRTIRITNAGGDTLRDTLTVDHPNFEFVTATAWLVPPGESVEATLRFMPNTTTHYQTTLEHRSNDLAQGLKNMVIKGRSVRDLGAGTLAGAVFYRDNSSVAGTIALIDSSNKVVSSQALSTSGTFRFSDAPEGTYTLLVREANDLIGSTFGQGSNGLSGSLRVVGGEQTDAVRIALDRYPEADIEVDLELDLNAVAGSQNVTAAEIPVEAPFSLSLYAGPITDLIGYSMQISFDTTLVSLVQIEERSDFEANILQGGDGTALYLQSSNEDGSVKHGGSILAADATTASSLGGLLGTWHFRTRNAFDTPSEIRVSEVVVRTLFGRRVVRPDLVAYIQPPGTGFSPIRLDLDVEEGNQEQHRLDGLATGNRIQLDLFLKGASSINGFGLLLEYDPETVKIGADDFVVNPDISSKVIPLIRQPSANTIEIGAALLEGVFAEKQLGQLFVELQEGFVGETQLTLREVVLNSLGRPPQTVTTKEVLVIAVTAPSAQIDFNGDGQLSFADFFLFVEAIGQENTNPRFDLDQNGQVTIADFFLFVDLFTQDDQTRAKLIALAEEHIDLPSASSLEQNYPNPFNSDTAIRYYIVDSQMVEIAVYNLAGQKVRTLLREALQAGSYNTSWDGRDDEGRPLASGLYLYRLLTTEGDTQTKKLLLLR